MALSSLVISIFGGIEGFAEYFQDLRDKNSKGDHSNIDFSENLLIIREHISFGSIPISISIELNEINMIENVNFLKNKLKREEEEEKKLRQKCNQ